MSKKGPIRLWRPWVKTFVSAVTLGDAKYWGENEEVRAIPGHFEMAASRNWPHFTAIGMEANGIYGTWFFSRWPNDDFDSRPEHGDYTWGYRRSKEVD